MANGACKEKQFRAGCYICHGSRAAWTGPNAQAVAVRHHTAFGHPTWCDVTLSFRYGEFEPGDGPAGDGDQDPETAEARTGDGQEGEPQPA